MRDRVAWKPRFSDPRVASTRIRCLNPLRELRSRGYPVELFDPSRVDDYAVVVYSKLYDSSTYREAEALQRRGVQIVLDLCDNHFYAGNGEPLKRMMALADELVVPTEAMAEVLRIELSRPKPITVIRDAVECKIEGIKRPILERCWEQIRLRKLSSQLTAANRGGRTPLVWFGIHGGPDAEFGMLDLLKVRPLLEQMNRRFPLSLTVISNSRKKYEENIRSCPFPTYYLRWYYETFFTALRAHSIAIIPISNNPFTRCKSSNRLTVSLYAGLAVVADSIPSYEPFGGTCYLGDWEKGLENYLSDPELRRRHVEMGRAIIAREWLIGHIADGWGTFFDRLLKGRPAESEAFATGLSLPFKCYGEHLNEIESVDSLSDRDLLELNSILRWNCFVLDRHGRRFGNAAREGKRDIPETVPDRRVSLINERFDLSDKHVIEIGCFEGIHTVSLCGYAKTVTAVDARIENVVKTMVRCSFFGHHPTVFKCNVEERPLNIRSRDVDIAFHVGVLYHLQDPVQHLLELGSFIRLGVLLDTHYALEEEAVETYESNGRVYRYKKYREGGHADVFSGMYAYSKWLRLDDITDLLRESGFPKVSVVEMRTERNGPRVLLVAEKVPSCRSSVLA
jgi:Protein of unknown function (DUF1698)